MNERWPMDYSGEYLLAGICSIGPGTFWPAWQLVMNHLTYRDRWGDSLPGPLVEAAATIVSRHRLAMPVIAGWFSEITSGELSANVDDMVVLKILGLSELLVRQYPDSHKAGTQLVALIERCYDVPRDHPALWPDYKVILMIVSYVKRLDGPVAQAALLSLLKRNPNKGFLMAETGFQNPWSLDERIPIDGPVPQDIFCEIIDSIVDLCGHRAEPLLARVAKELGGKVSQENLEHIRKRLGGSNSGGRQ